MKVFEVRYPGTFLDCQDEHAGMQVQGLLSNLETHLAEAALGLALFEQHYPSMWDDPGPRRRADAVRAIRDEMERALPPGHRPTFLENVEISQAADLESRRREWLSGHLPHFYNSVWGARTSYRASDLGF
jgi:hypothetical protein